MGKRLELAGQCFGRLTVISETRVGSRRGWQCACSCGSNVEVITASLMNGKTKSCGCLVRDNVAQSNKNRASELTNTPTYISWKQMKQRCLNPNAPDYKNYGGRGVTICEKWIKFAGFYEDMGERPEGLTLDRIDNNGNYNKENCKWSTRAEQNRNKRGLVNF